jgi:protein TonB
MLGALRAGKADRLNLAGPGVGGPSAPFVIFVVIGLVLHASLIGFVLLWEGFFSPPRNPEPEPIAVELVEEPPQPEPAPKEEPPAEEQKEAQQEPPPPPEQQAQAEPEPPPEPEKAELPPTVPLDEAPAYDAPKSAQNDKELTLGDATSGPPVAAMLPEPPLPEPLKPPAEPERPPPAPVKAEAQTAQQDAPPVPPLPPEPDGVSAQAPSSPVDAAEDEKAEPEKQDQTDKPDAKRFAFFAPLPKMEFETGGKPSRAPSGNAEATYTSTLYGMIVPLVRIPPGLPPSARRRPLRVEFVVDGRGNLVASVLSRSSGVPSLDIAALAAIRQAAPFPPTPHGKSLGLVLDYSPQ